MTASPGWITVLEALDMDNIHSFRLVENENLFLRIDLSEHSNAFGIRVTE